MLFETDTHPGRDGGQGRQREERGSGSYTEGLGMCATGVEEWGTLRGALKMGAARLQESQLLK